MKVYIKAWLEKNLGDDLFIKIISERYSDNFIAMTQTDYSNLQEYYPNIRFLKYNIILDKLIKLFSFKTKTLEHVLSSRCDIILYLGGSMFMEIQNQNYSFYTFKKDYYILGSNFGPYYTKKFYKMHRDLFKNAKDVCFRDYYSYSMFNSLENVRSAPDIVFTLKTDNIKMEEENKIVISVINPKKKVGIQYYNDYLDFILSQINYYIKHGFRVTLMSFCKEEGDEDMIDTIISKIGNLHLREKIDTYFYNGNINQALNILGTSKIIVGSRFHANILGLIMKKTIVPIAYSDKTINVLNDLCFNGKVYDIRKKDDMNFDNFDINSLNYVMDVTPVQMAAEKHFKILDKILKRKE